ncbi:MAG TPA: hypothetical protein DCS89_00140 [Gammaproteobacteria bacterium]|nr:hypothetical protein [Gammaproteobacteria bacterium]HAT25392.1 hypothetical protein [Gammaproteobacteria bacterium]
MKSAVAKVLVVACLGTISNPSLAAEAELEHAEAAVEEIVVTSTLHRSRADTALPVNILAGEELREKVAATLGETLQDQVGVSIGSFGPGVGAVVIRGQGGNRVQVLQGGVGNIDASSISADHANSLEPALAERIEVLRGPATLLYGNGAIGGVVNVIDNRIPTRLPEALGGFIETRNNSASDQQVSVFKLESGAGQFAWHLDAVYRESNDVEVNGYAINPDTVNFEDEGDFAGLIASKGKIPGSNTRSHAGSIGGSWILDGGYVGVSYNRLENEYGIPGRAAELHEAAGGTRILMRQDRTDIELQLPLAGILKEVHGRVSQVDYQHVEVEPEGEIGTLFEQEGVEGRFTFHLGLNDNHEGVFGLHFSHRNFSALGEEAFMPRTDIDSLALFTVHSLDVDTTTFEFGLRAERRSLAQIDGSCDDSSTSFSGSASSIWRFREDMNLLLSYAYSQRSATVEELYSNIDTGCNALALDELILHVATRRFEIGDPRAEREASNNVEIGLRKHLGNVTGELNIFYNEISDYLFLFDTGIFRDGIEISSYAQEDAMFQGVEAQLGFPIFRNGEHLSELSVFADYVSAKFDSSGNVPRIPPLRFGAELRHSHLHWQARLRLTQVQDQSSTASKESKTEGHTLLNIYLDYHVTFGDRTGILFLKGSNLLDESIRWHTSLLKDVAPAPGRAIEIGLRFEF